jgi:hypothetical protein
VNSQSPGAAAAGPAAPAPRRALGLRVVTVIVALEAALMWGVTAWLVVELLTETPGSVGGAFALLGLSALAAVWVSFIAYNLPRRRSWTRGGALTWQFVQIMVAIGAFQGVYARPDVGWALLAPSLLVIALLFTRAVVAATSPVPLYPDEPDEPGERA